MSHSHVMSQMSYIQYSCHKVISWCNVTNIWNSILMTIIHVMPFHNIWYSVLMSHSHVMSKMYDNKNSCHTVTLCHKCLIFRIHVTDSCHVMSQKFDIQFSFYTVMSCHKYLILGTHATESVYVILQMSDIHYSCHTVMKCHKYLIFSDHVTESYQATNVWYQVRQSCQVISCQNVWYSGLLSYSHIMSQMSDNQYSCRTVMSCHKYLMYSTHITVSFHVMSQISDIQYSCQTYK